MFDFIFESFYELPLWCYIVVSFLVFIGSLIDAIAGGGGLITLPAFILSGLPPHLAIGTNKFSSSFGTIFSTLKYYRNGYVDTKIIVPIVACSIIGSIIGSKAVLLMSTKTLEYFIVGILPFIALVVLTHKKINYQEKLVISSHKEWIKLSLIVLSVGFYDGFYGPGTGTFLIIAFTYIMHMNAIQASGNTKIANLTSNIVALVVFIVNGNIYYPIALTAVVFSILGHIIGANIMIKNGATIVRPIIILVISMLLIKTLWSIFL